MDITIFGYKFRLEILILIAVVYFIMSAHVVCSCSRIPIVEGFNFNWGGANLTNIRLCFDQDTQIETLSGKFIPISDICVGEVLKDESIVTAKMKLDATNIEMYSIKDIIVSGGHYVKSSSGWIHVSEDERSKKIDTYKNPYIYCLNTTSKIILINGITFSDWDDTFDEKLSDKKNYIAKKFNLDPKQITEKDIHIYLDGGFDESTIICLNDGTNKLISEIQINDVLENGECVYALVEIDGSNIKEQFNYNLGKNKYFVGGSNLNFFDENLGQTSTLKLRNESICSIKTKSEKLYHLLTDKGTFKVGDLIFNDYNSCIDLE